MPVFTVLLRRFEDSVHRADARLLVEAGIDAISVNIDAVDRARRLVAAAERRVMLGAARSDS